MHLVTSYFIIHTPYPIPHTPIPHTPCTPYAEGNKREIVSQGAVTPLLKLTRVHDPRVQRNAAGALLNLTHVGEFRAGPLNLP